ncbi:TadE family type IV pilus minor pilin [Gephyromycinifex aptenodytis]|uniref:TadE family type IV pilus minor pilin n=1 Tax=Gephyromycinifex aptenodytis TaxID=2716227 RepID=UPI001446F838|nr:TadE family type IV pilus minor pilin [Gephyromycinifex aptenodytis]
MRSREAGMVTAEFAVAMPVLIAVLALVMAAMGLALDQVRCVDAARAGARLAARGEPESVVIAEAARLAPTGSQVHLRGGAVLTVQVTAPPPLAVLGRIPQIPRARASASLPAEAVLGAGP